MSKPVTEIARVPLVPGLNLEEGETKNTLNNVLSTIAAQEGNLGVFWGVGVESPSVLEIAADWDKIESHQKFTNSPEYGPFMASVTSLLAGPPDIKHYQIPDTSPFKSPASAPVTEIAELYFPADFDLSKAHATMTKFGELIKEKGKGSRDVSGGPAIEKATHEKLGDGVEGSLYRAFIGWDSVEAHMAFRETEAFKEGMELLTKEKPTAAEVYHVKYQKFT